MGSSRVLRIIVRAAPALAAVIACAGCYEPAVREQVVLSFEQDGGLKLSVRTTFRRGSELSWQDREEIRRVLDLYELGRDPWLRGFERAGATGVSHRCEGAEGAPESIVREADLPSVESLVAVMPDAIANFRLRDDARDGTLTLSIVPIDVPESIRANRHRMEREVASLSKAIYRFTEGQCDLYDYLAGSVERRGPVLRALLAPDRIADSLTPEETSLIERLNKGLQGLEVFSAGAEDPNGEGPTLSRMSFSAFEHDFCVKLPVEAVSAVGLRRDEESGGKNTWCAERLVTDDLVERLWADADPPLSTLDEVPQDAGELAALPFTCARYEDDKEVAGRAWELILPRPFYAITWRPAVRVSG